MTMNPISALRILPADITPTAPTAAADKTDFLDTLKDAMGKVDGLQGQAEQKVSALLEGNGRRKRTRRPQRNDRGGKSRPVVSANDASPEQNCSGLPGSIPHAVLARGVRFG